MEEAPSNSKVISTAELIARGLNGKVEQNEKGISVKLEDSTVYVIPMENGEIDISLQLDASDISDFDSTFPNYFTADEIAEVVFKVGLGHGEAGKLKKEIIERHSK